MHSDHHHSHMHNHQRTSNRQSLAIALIITAGIMILEFAGGIMTRSLALLSDAGHMLSDVASLALSLIAFWFAARPPSSSKTYGYYRFEILAALFNGITLFVIAGFIVWEAVERFLNPAVVKGNMMMLIAVTGLLANLSSAWVLLHKGDTKDNLNLRSAYLHVLGDALGSLGAIVAGLLISLFSWNIVDPVVSIVVALIILKNAWGVITHSFHILMEGTPVTINHEEVEKKLQGIPGVINVHDLHIWTISSGLDSLSCHLLVHKDTDHQQILHTAIQLIEKHFAISHTTIQIETTDFQHPSNHVLH
ncbi:cation diffusion facilitator family transporter [Thermoactinomyces mirandus]|uniref:Cation transporter n=1 Tax=Thermoactinomyces mirandus TaxID=2756294 RepID=A0A7W1XR69_9BACL|nr:cation diffusion facilitator family transporter [Thermoactinomyces mirandus]MBA4601788.1 cation transporter [Thermoactinomyces mirandus]